MTNLNKSLKYSILLTFAFILIIRLRPIWERYTTKILMIFLFLTIIILFFLIMIKLIIELIKILSNLKNLNFISILPFGILLIGLLDGIFNPLRIDLDKIYGDVTFRACYEGTQNQATFILRSKNKFEIHWTGAFFYSEYFYGTYNIISDTLFLQNESDNNIPVGEKLFMDNKNKILRPIQIDSDNLKNRYIFYYGYCKGLN